MWIERRIAASSSGSSDGVEAGGAGDRQAGQAGQAGQARQVGQTERAKGGKEKAQSDDDDDDEHIVFKGDQPSGHGTRTSKSTPLSPNDLPSEALQPGYDGVDYIAKLEAHVAEEAAATGAGNGKGNGKRKVLPLVYESTPGPMFGCTALLGAVDIGSSRGHSTRRAAKQAAAAAALEARVGVRPGSVGAGVVDAEANTSGAGMGVGGALDSVASMDIVDEEATEAASFQMVDCPYSQRPPLLPHEVRSRTHKLLELVLTRF